MGLPFARFPPLPYVPGWNVYICGKYVYEIGGKSFRFTRGAALGSLIALIFYDIGRYAFDSGLKGPSTDFRLRHNKYLMAKGRQTHFTLVLGSTYLQTFAWVRAPMCTTGYSTANAEKDLVRKWRRLCKLHFFYT